MDPHVSLPDSEFYAPIFAPWRGWGEFGSLFAKARPFTIVSADRCWILYSLARQAAQLRGNFYEAGVFRGGTALILCDVMMKAVSEGPQKSLRLFDTFSGMPEADPDRDIHRSGAFGSTFMEAVKILLGNEDRVSLYPGIIPDTFTGLENDEICFAHVDVDLYRSILDTCEFVYPRLSPSGFMLFDDYGFPTCPGARQAVDEFFADKPEIPLVLPTGQAIVTKCA